MPPSLFNVERRLFLKAEAPQPGCLCRACYGRVWRVPAPSCTSETARGGRRAKVPDNRRCVPYVKIARERRRHVRAKTDARPGIFIEWVAAVRDFSRDTLRGYGTLVILQATVEFAKVEPRN